MYNNYDPNEKLYVNYTSEDIAAPYKEKKRGGSVIAMVLAMLLIGGASGFGGAYISSQYFKSSDNSNLNAHSNSSNVQNTANTTTSSVVNVLDKYTDGTYTIESIYDMVRPSIVDVDIYAKYRNEVLLMGQGSGIIYSEDGYILSNAHVVSDADKIIVRLSTGEEYEAKVIGSDTATDVAVMKIEASGLPKATFGDSSTLKMGEAVVAIGNPAGFSGTITNGIVSGLNQILDSTQVSNLECIQTTAAINPGVSGGALINMYGEVIGITSSKYVAEGYDNIGFAIAINEALPIVNDLVKQGYVSKPIIGITCMEISDTLGQVYGEIPGLKVSEIRSDCAVINSGLKVGDTITKINGTDVRSTLDVASVISKNKLKPGDTITATVIRRDELGREKEHEIDIVLSTYTEDRKSVV